MAHTENGKEVLDDVVEEIGDLAVVEQQARLEGRNMFLILAPNMRK
jgi:translation initiation factor IF-3